MAGGATLLEQMDVYQKACLLADSVWDIVDAWKYFEKKTVGDQLVRSIDSIGANIAEGYGRYHYGEKLKFYY